MPTFRTLCSIARLVRVRSLLRRLPASSVVPPHAVINGVPMVGYTADGRWLYYLPVAFRRIPEAAE